MGGREGGREGGSFTIDFVSLLWREAGRRPEVISYMNMYATHLSSLPSYLPASLRGEGEREGGKEGDKEVGRMARELKEGERDGWMDFQLQRRDRRKGKEGEMSGRKLGTDGIRERQLGEKRS